LLEEFDGGQPRVAGSLEVAFGGLGVASVVEHESHLQSIACTAEQLDGF
jgi:hypothetical protein